MASKRTFELAFRGKPTASAGISLNGFGPDKVAFPSTQQKSDQVQMVRASSAAKACSALAMDIPLRLRHSPKASHCLDIITPLANVSDDADLVLNWQSQAETRRKIVPKSKAKDQHRDSLTSVIQDQSSFDDEIPGSVLTEEDLAWAAFEAAGGPAKPKTGKAAARTSTVVPVERKAKLSSYGWRLEGLQHRPKYTLQFSLTVRVSKMESMLISPCLLNAKHCSTVTEMLENFVKMHHQHLAPYSIGVDSFKDLRIIPSPEAIEALEGEITLHLWNEDELETTEMLWDWLLDVLHEKAQAICEEQATKRQKKAYGVEGPNSIKRDPVLGETLYTNVVCCLSNFESDSISESPGSSDGMELVRME